MITNDFKLPNHFYVIWYYRYWIIFYLIYLQDVNYNECLPMYWTRGWSQLNHWKYWIALNRTEHHWKLTVFFTRGLQFKSIFSAVQFSSVIQLCSTPCTELIDDSHSIVLNVWEIIVSEIVLFIGFITFFGLDCSSICTCIVVGSHHKLFRTKNSSMKYHRSSH